MLLLLLFCCGLITPAQQQANQPDAMAMHRDDTAKVNLWNKLSASYADAYPDSMLYYAKTAHTLAKKIRYKAGMAEAGKNIAVFYRLRGDYPAALDHYITAIRLYDSLQLQLPLANVYLSTAQLYKDMAGSHRTEEYLDQGLSYSEHSYNLYHNVQDTASMVLSLNVSGIIYRDIGLKYKKNYYDTAFITYQKALSLIRASGKGKEYLGKLYNNISQVYLEYKKDYNTALDYLFKAEAYNISNSNVSSLSYNYGNISECYIKLNDNSRSLLYARKMLAAAQEINRPTRMLDAYLQLFRSFKSGDGPDSALHYYQLADHLEDSLTSLAKTQQVMDLQTKYETRRKESEILQLQLEGRNKNKSILLLGITLLVFVVLAGILIWLYRQVKKQQVKITEQSLRLEVMMKELHHRVKNNLQIVSSLLSLQSYKTQDEQTVSVLKESQQRVQAMSFIHQRLYKKDDLTAVNMKDYLTDLAESLVASYGYHPDSFDLQVLVNKEMLDIDRALPIGLIINEMVTNALKYAYADVERPLLQIILKNDVNNITVEVKDNGSGINETAWYQQNNSFGKQLIKALCKQLRAKQSLEVNGGTRFIITIQKQAA